MGFDYKRIPLYREAEKSGLFGLFDLMSDCEYISNRKNSVVMPFKEPAGWFERMAKK